MNADEYRERMRKLDAEIARLSEQLQQLHADRLMHHMAGHDVPEIRAERDEHFRRFMELMTADPE